MVTASEKLGPYRVIAPLGAGGMGEVFRARDERLGREVAIKVLPSAVANDPRRVARFEREARALAALSHPNVLDIHDVGRDGEVIYLVTELLEGETLRQRLSRGALPWRKAVEIAAGVADGLSAAHGRGILHRDLKPENVFLTSAGRVKILDFGLARHVDGPISTEGVTESFPPLDSGPGSVVGTVGYMSPEQVRGLPLDARSDVFAVGCLLYEMVSGRRAFGGETAADTVAAILDHDPPRLDAAGASPVPPALAQTVARCLEKKAEERFDTAHDLLLALQALSVGTATAPLGPGSGRSRARLRFLVLVAGAIVALSVPLWLRRLAAPAREISLAGRAHRQVTSAPGVESEPALSPDGTLVAYVSDETGAPDVWVTDVRTRETRNLTTSPADDRSPAWLPDGRSLVFSSDRSGKRSIWRVSVLGDQPSLVVEDGQMPALSPSAERIAFARPGPSGALRIHVAAFPPREPEGSRPLTGDGDGLWDHVDPAFSPDGRTICYADWRDLWLVDVDGGEPRSLTDAHSFDVEPVFSPQGDAVLFFARREGVGAIWSVPVGGGAPRRLTNGTGPEGHPSVSRDGRLVAYTTYARNGDVAIVDRRSGRVERFGSILEDDTPAMAPDGTAVAFTSNRLGTFDLWLQPLREGRVGGPLRRLTFHPEEGPATPAFSPDGSWIAYFRAVRGKRDIWAISTAGGASRRLTEDPVRAVHPAISPDGTRLAFVSARSGVENVWVVPLRDGTPDGAAWPLTTGLEQAMFPAWSPDGKLLAFLRLEDAWVTEPRAGAAPRRVTAGVDAHHLAWDADGGSLLVAGSFGTSRLHVRRVRIADGSAEELRPVLPMGGSSGSAFLSLSRDGRYLAAQVVDAKGDVWVAESRTSGP